MFNDCLQNFIIIFIISKGERTPTTAHAAGEAVRHAETQRGAPEEDGGAKTGAREGEGAAHRDTPHGAGDPLRDEASRRGHGRT
jgi:hypothetical protein